MAFPFRRKKRAAPFDNNEAYPGGSSKPASIKDAENAGLFRKTDTAIYCGMLHGRPLWYDGEGGVLMVAGARSGKLRDVLAYTLCKGICDDRTIIVLDPKGELAAISKDQVLGDGRTKKVITFNPRGLHSLPQHKINPVAYLKWSSPTLIPDLKLFLEGWTLRANKRETTTRLKFTLEGAGERTHGYAFTDPPFAGCRIGRCFAHDIARPRCLGAGGPHDRTDAHAEAAQFHSEIQTAHSG